MFLRHTAGVTKHLQHVAVTLQRKTKYVLPIMDVNVFGRMSIIPPTVSQPSDIFS